MHGTLRGIAAACSSSWQGSSLCVPLPVHPIHCRPWHTACPLTLPPPTAPNALQNPDSEDVTIAVALFDAGEFASTHPQGRSLATSTGLKDAVLLHLETKRKSMDDVKQQALMAMSKIIRA
jgi:hypothetical protein